MVKKFELETNTVDFIGHAVALYTNDLFLDKPAIETIDRIKLYMDSYGRYGDSPFIYPIYGLGGIPEGFSRMAAVNGGTFMLQADVDEVLFDGEGKVSGLRSAKVKELMGLDQINCKKIICDPSYALKAGLTHKVKSVGKVVRCICIMNHMIPNTKDVPSAQVIIPQRQVGRKNGTLASSPTFQTSSSSWSAGSTTCARRASPSPSSPPTWKPTTPRRNSSPPSPSSAPSSRSSSRYASPPLPP